MHLRRLTFILLLAAVCVGSGCAVLNLISNPVKFVTEIFTGPQGSKLRNSIKTTVESARGL